MINLLLLNNFYPAMSYRRVRNDSDELGHSLRSAIGCQRKWLNEETTLKKIPKI